MGYKLVPEMLLSRYPPLRRPWVRVVLAGLVPPGAATLLTLVPSGISTAAAALAYVLAVVAAAATAGLPGGLAASLVSFLALNFFFTEPFHTFRVSKAEDLIALGVFLVVSLVVGALFSIALSERARAGRQEREARLQHHLGARLLAGEPTEQVLATFAHSLVELFELADCEVTTDFGEARIGGEASDGVWPADAVTFAMAARGREVGTIRATPGPFHPQLGLEERHVIQGLANQLALAMDGLRHASEAHQVRLEAEKDRLRAALFSSVTHDLKTPLSSIKTSVTGLLDLGTRFSPADHRDLLETIRHEEERLNRLVGNLLYLSRIRAGAMEPEESPADVQDLIGAVVGRLEPELKDHPVTLTVREDLPSVPMDVVQIDQAVTNILENAAKFSRPGSPISIQVARWHDVVEVRVSDRGPGIPPEDRERMFEPFTRGEGHSSPGTGLGLSIVQAIVAAHGGKVRIEGAPGGGAAVIFTLPVKA